MMVFTDYWHILPALFCLLLVAVAKIHFEEQVIALAQNKQAGRQGSLPCLLCFMPTISTCSSK
jgi:hypothetical protein